VDDMTVMFLVVVVVGLVRMLMQVWKLADYVRRLEGKGE
jgi:hypothetical protein